MKTVACITAALLCGCASPSFVGTPDMNCPAASVANGTENSVAEAAKALVGASVKVQAAQPMMHAENDADVVATRTVLVNYVKMAGPSLPDSHFGDIDGPDPVSSADIVLGRQVLALQPPADNQPMDGASALLQAEHATFSSLSMCMTTSGILPDTAAAQAKLAQDFITTVSQRTAPLRDVATKSDGSEVSLGKFSTSDRELALEAVRLHGTGAFCSLQQDRVGKVRRYLESGDAAGLQKEKPMLDAVRFIGDYESAYFRGGQLLSVSFDAGDASKTIVGKLPPDISKVLNKSQTSELTTVIQTELETICPTKPAGASTSCLLTNPLGTESFVSRAGQSVQFSGVTVSVGQNGVLRPQFEYPKVATFAPQVLKVFVEALFDASAPHVPAAATSTACVDGLYSNTAGGVAECMTDTAAKTVIGTDAKGADVTLQTAVSRIDTDAASADALGTSITGTAIRGLNVVSLNNEAIANSVEAFAGVMLRKIVEKAEWSRVQVEVGGCAGSGVVVVNEAGH